MERQGSRQRGLILAATEVPDEVVARLEPFGDIVVVEPSTDEAEWISRAADCIAIIARGNTRVSRQLIQAAPALRVIGRSGVGVDLIDIDEATAHRIPVVITPGMGSNAVAEGALAMLLALMKQLNQLDQLVREGRWSEREAVVIKDLEGSSIAIVGVGRIGRRLTDLCLAMGMNVLAVDPPARASGLDLPAGAEWAELTDALRTADVVSLHVPLSESTQSLLDLNMLRTMKPGAILLNLGRGALISSYDDLLLALADGPLGGVGLDTFPVEPPDVAHPLFAHDRVLFSPHVLGLSQRARRQIFDGMAIAMARILSGHVDDRVANPAVWSKGAGDGGGG